MNREFGDFQTPLDLVRLVLDCIHRDSGSTSWARALEPTCGSGSFVRGILSTKPPPREVIGLEVQDVHVAAAMSLARGAASTRVAIRQANLFDLNLASDLHWAESGPLLVVGNPPWITNAALGVLGRGNLPKKHNIKSLNGLAAITGAANFDICEYVWIKLLTELAGENPTIALLCKTAVARNVLQFAWRRGIPLEGGFLRRIDAPRWFGAAVDACLFCLRVRAGAAKYEIPVYPDLTASTPDSIMGMADGRFVADVSMYRSAAFADGQSPLIWRQGVKHDARAIMELEETADGTRLNGLGEVVDVEGRFVFPLLKSSDLFHGTPPRRWVIVPQRSLGDDTRRLMRAAPALWRYLARHEVVFRQRKSSIYRTQPPFAVFGIGDYTFAGFKVAVAGLHKQPRFRAIGPVQGMPVVFDDTCYFVPCESARQAALVAALLGSELASHLLRALLFPDAKRPVTKALLQRIDLIALAGAANRSEVLGTAESHLHSLSGESGSWPGDLTVLVRPVERPVADAVAAPIDPLTSAQSPES